MAIVPVMWIVWGVLVVLTAALYIYRMTLTRDEEDQLFLDDSFEHEKSEQTVIIERVNKLEPYLKTSLWLVSIATVFVIGYYVMDIYAQFNNPK